MRKLILPFVLLLPLAAVSDQKGQPTTERTAIVAVAQNYMDAYYTADASKMERALHPDFHKRTLHLVNSEIQMREDTVSSMLAGVRSGSGLKIPSSERVRKIEVLDVYKNAANVKVTTGRWVDYMLISKFDGQWRVLDVVLQYTKD